jgi:hypothetical protein
MICDKEDIVMPKKDGAPDGAPEVTWQDQLAQAGAEPPADKEWKRFASRIEKT